ncbi:MAG: hypothetical protein Roseis2KO_39180 [Roseivirga sp.]
MIESAMVPYSLEMLSHTDLNGDEKRVISFASNIKGMSLGVKLPFFTIQPEKLSSFVPVKGKSV